MFNKELTSTIIKILQDLILNLQQQILQIDPRMQRRKQKKQAAQTKKKHNNQQKPKPDLIQQLVYCLTQKNQRNTTFTQQITQFLTYLTTTTQKTYIYPTILNNNQTEHTNTRQQIQIYTLRDNEKLIRYRIVKKRQVNKSKKVENKDKDKDKEKEKEKQRQRQRQKQKQRQKLVFMMQGQLCLNCIILAMINNQKVQIGLGSAREGIDRAQNKKAQDNKLYTQQVNIKNIQLYKQCQQYILNKTKQYSKSSNKIGKNRQINNGRVSAFYKLKQLIIDINNQTMTIEQWINSLVIVKEIIKIVAQENLINLEKLEINIQDHRQYYQGVSNNRSIREILAEIYDKTKYILDSKLRNTAYIRNRKNMQQYQCYFPKLRCLSFNPMFYLVGMKYMRETQPNLQAQSEQYNKVQQNLDNQIQQDTNKQTDQSNIQTPLKVIHLVGLTTQINKIDNLNLLLTQLFPYFPKISHLTLKMRNRQLFQKFNQLLSHLYKYSPYIQSLQILKNLDHVNKQQGLRCVLKHYPFLCDLNINIWPRFKQVNNVQQEYRRRIEVNQNNGRQQNNPVQLQLQFKIQWEYVKEINFRKLHLQRMINMIKILEKKGYDQYQIRDILQFMRPLKFQNIIR